MCKTRRRVISLFMALMMVVSMTLPALAADAKEPTAAELEEQQLTEEALAEASEILGISTDELEKLDEVPIPEDDDPAGQENFAKAVTAVSKHIKLSATELELKAGDLYDVNVVPRGLARMFHWRIGNVEKVDKEYLSVRKIDQETLTIQFKGEKTGGKVGFKVMMEDKPLNDLVEKNPDLQKYVDEIEENFKESMSCDVATTNTETRVIAGVGISKEPGQTTPNIPVGGGDNGVRPSKPAEETPSPAPSNAPKPSTVPDQSPKPDPTKVPQPTDEPSISPEPSNEPSVSPIPTDEPTASPEPSQEPSESPKPSEEPSESPVPTIKPSEQPIPTLGPPMPPPTVSPKPSQEPSESPKPSASPDVSESPSPSPSDSPDPSESPEPTISPDPSDEPTTSPEPTDEPTSSPEPSESPNPSESPEPSDEPSISPSPTPDECDHQWNEETDVCVVCGALKPGHEHVYSEITDKCKCGELNPNHVHGYDETDRCKCGKLNPEHKHRYDEDGDCVCGDRNQHDHRYNPADGTGKCTVEGCTVDCDHGGEMPVTVEKCPICGVTNPKYHDCATMDHVWKDGTCEVCHTVCTHPNVKVGKPCDICDVAEKPMQPHDVHIFKYDEGSKTSPCTIDGCPETCGHERMTKDYETCPDCGMPNDGYEEPDHEHDFDSTDGHCKVEGCTVVCPHAGMAANNLPECPVCQMKNDKHKHDWQNKDGICAFENCDGKCDHGGEMAWDVPECPECGKANENYYDHDKNGHAWDNGVCKYCREECNHPRSNAEGKCVVCGIDRDHIGDHHWWNPETGKCEHPECNAVCLHESTEIGEVCPVCGMTKPEFDCNAGRHHWNSETGECPECHTKCEHPDTVVGAECGICHMIKPMEEHDKHIYQYDPKTGTGKCTIEGCPAVCEHSKMTSADEVCPDCSMPNNDYVDPDHKHSCKYDPETGKSECIVEGCTEICTHPEMNGNLEQCEGCGMPNEAYVKLIHGEEGHQWVNGVCTAEKCGLVCDHAGMDNLPKCPTCHMENVGHKHEFDPETGKCTIDGCDFQCEHEQMGNLLACPTCGMKNDKHTHDMSNNDGVCAVEGCDYECDHGYEDGVMPRNVPSCSICGKENENYHDCATKGHIWQQEQDQKGDGVCEVCGERCTHGDTRPNEDCSNCHLRKPRIHDENNHWYDDSSTGICVYPGCNEKNPNFVGGQETPSCNHTWRHVDNGPSVCTVEGCGATCEHTGMNGNETCPTCGKVNLAYAPPIICTEHVDTDGDGKCDNEGCGADVPITGGETETPAATPTPTPTPGSNKDEDDDDDGQPTPTPTPGSGGDDPDTGGTGDATTVQTPAQGGEELPED